MRLTKQGSLIVALLLAGCTAAPTTLHPMVEIDPTFTDEERAGIQAGLQAWEDAAPEVHFGLGPDAIRFVRGAATQCPLHGAGSEQWVGDVSTICLDHDYISANGGRYQAVTQHEVGHTLHLSHTTDVSVMATPYSAVSDEITPRDVLELRRIWK